MRKHENLYAKAAKEGEKQKLQHFSPHIPIYTSLQYSPMLERQIVINSICYTARGKIQYPIEQEKKHEI